MQVSQGLTLASRIDPMRVAVRRRRGSSVVGSDMAIHHVRAEPPNSTPTTTTSIQVSHQIYHYGHADINNVQAHSISAMNKKSQSATALRRLM
jgi:hypothetical protein